MIAEFDCATCGRHVRKRRSPANTKTPPRFCSQKCHGVAIKGCGIGTRPNHTFNCESCGVAVKTYRSPSARTPRFCSLKCIGDVQSGSGNPAFNGGRHVMKNGYAVISMPHDPEADARGYVYEHRLVARSIVGRALDPFEVVHHVNGDKTDNDPSNLIVFPNQGAHMRHHMRTAQWNFSE